MALTIENGGRIVTQQFLDQFINVTGAGMTIGLVIYMIFFAKSAQCKELGRLGGVPGLFNINEPILFGTPIVMNPFLAIYCYASHLWINLILLNCSWISPNVWWSNGSMDNTTNCFRVLSRRMENGCLTNFYFSFILLRLLTIYSQNR